MSSHLSVSQTLGLLDTLRRTIREFALREERLNREFRNRIEGVDRRLKSDLETLDAQTSADLSAAETEFTVARERLAARYTQRKVTISKAHKTSARQGMERIDNEEGRLKYPIQKGLLDTKRNREEALRQNDAALGKFQVQLAASREELGQLEAAAARAVRGYGRFRRWVSSFRDARDPDLSRNEREMLQEIRQLHARASEDISRFRKLALPRVFSLIPLSVWIVLIAVCAGVLPLVARQVGTAPFTYAHSSVLAAIAFAALCGVHFQSSRKASSLAASIARSLEAARRLHEVCSEKAHGRHGAEIQRIDNEARAQTQRLEQDWQTAQQAAGEARDLWPHRLEEKWRHLSQKHEKWYRSTVGRLEHDHAARVASLQSNATSDRQRLTEDHAQKTSRLKAEHTAEWQKIETDWKQRIEPIYASIQAANESAQAEFPAWNAPQWKGWTPPAAFRNAAKFGQLTVNLKKVETAPQDQRLAFAPEISLPLLLTYPHEGSILIESNRSGTDEIAGALNNIIYRLLATSPPGKLTFTIIDPVRLGQNFAAVMHLADFEENIVNGRIWTQGGQIEERLADLNEHMEKVIQMYLRNEYATIAEYNVEAGNIAEKYHFVVIADFPAGFTESSVRRLLRIAASGARCGVYTLIHWDHRQAAPPDYLPDELRKSSVCIQLTDNHFEIAHPAAAGARIFLDAPPAPEMSTEFLRAVGTASRGANRVEVPFAQVAPEASQLWSLETTDELRVPIGRCGATKLQYLAIGKGTRQHALIAGKTGSGKSTLFHVIITNLASWCSPEQVEFYLVDFKKGVEFKGYAARRLPHARVVAIESDREFGLSVLQRVDDELKRRGDLFRKLGVQDVAGYKRAGGNEPMPRSLLLIDEFQEFFVEDDRISQAANVLLDRIVRQGRAFGIHVLLGSQTLGGAYTLARTTIGQMVIRIALQCNEADAYLIMDDTNPAPRLLSRPGEGIYNDMAGAVEGNSPFQTVWLPDEERDAHLQKIRQLADGKGASFAGPIVFEGNAPADPRENYLLERLLQAESVTRAPTARVWLGAPNSIKGPTEAAFSRRAGNNLIIVGQRDEASLALLAMSFISLAAQFPRGAVRFVLLESEPPGSPERAFLEKLVQALPHETTLAPTADVPDAIDALAQELDRRTEDERANAAETFVLVHGLQNFKKLRQEEDFSFSMGDADKTNNSPAQFQKLISEGPSHGIHIIATIDTYNNVNRFLGRKTLSECEMRVLFQMSANDSASLCDDPKGSALGLHRALFYNEQEGHLETFRPYALPDAAWLEETARRISRLVRQ
ncbi:MAG: ATP-binding protein [Verrucomicrobia subdivision 3 bacterium]|nr:ATP-binding protein [Limisphaerales bacterium]